jgi:hypothetical protein
MLAPAAALRTADDPSERSIPQARRVRLARGPGLVAPDSPADGRSDRRAIGRVRFASILGLVAGVTLVVGLVGAAAGPALGVGQSVSSGSGGGLSNSSGSVTVVFPVSSGWYLVAFWVPSLLSIGAVALLWAGLRDLSRVSREFKVPSKVAPVALAGLVLGLVGLSLLSAGPVAESACGGPSGGLGLPGAGFCVSYGAVLDGLVVGTAGVIVAEVGYVAIAIGMMRLAVRHRSPAARVGGLLLVLPLVSLAGYLLLLVKTTRWIRPR